MEFHENADIEARLDRIEQKVSEMHEIVMNLVKGIGNAQMAGGMPGMMARQLPDMTQFTG